MLFLKEGPITSVYVHQAMKERTARKISTIAFMMTVEGSVLLQQDVSIWQTTFTADAHSI